jgi:hypothetical protein
MTPKSKYGALSPYSMCDAQGRIMENVWQRKLYAFVPEMNAPLGKWSSLRWQHPKQTHVDVTGLSIKTDSLTGKEIHVDPETNRLIGKITQEYIDWVKKLAAFPEAVRYPVGFDHRTACIGHVVTPEDGSPLQAGDQPQILNYIDARKQKYGPLYMNGLEQCELAHKLRERWNNGENLLIIEVDVAPERSLAYYIKNYHVDKTFIHNNTMLATLEHLKLLLEDPKEQFGHGNFAAAWIQRYTIQDIENARSLKRSQKRSNDHVVSDASAESKKVKNETVTKTDT